MKRVRGCCGRGEERVTGEATKGTTDTRPTTLKTQHHTGLRTDSMLTSGYLEDNADQMPTPNFCHMRSTCHGHSERHVGLWRKSRGGGGREGAAAHTMPPRPTRVGGGVWSVFRGEEWWKRHTHTITSQSGGEGVR